MWRNIFTGKERRRFVRLPAELSVDFRINGESADTPWHKGVTKDISPEGLCLVTDLFSREKWQEIMQKKNHIHLQINFPRGNEKIKAEAEVHRIDMEAQVVWQHHEKKEGKEKCLLGLQFTRIEKDYQEHIRQYIIDNLIKAYRPA